MNLMIMTVHNVSELRPSDAVTQGKFIGRYSTSYTTPLLITLKVPFIPSRSFVEGGAQSSGDYNHEGWVSMSVPPVPKPDEHKH
jgi:hypothetical protein